MANSLALLPILRALPGYLYQPADPALPLDVASVPDVSATRFGHLVRLPEYIGGDYASAAERRIAERFAELALFRRELHCETFSTGSTLPRTTAPTAYEPRDNCDDAPLRVQITPAIGSTRERAGGARRRSHDESS